jgi:hypothetical protein
MSNIPTAEQFLIKNIGYGSKDVEYQMIEFAKMHVQEALKYVIKQLDDEGANHVRNSVLNAYPLDLIK